MKSHILFLASLLTINAISYDWEYLPDEKNYTPGQSDYKAYTTESIFNSSQYVLTYDDGPHEINTPKILDLLKKHNKKATFFLVTSRINEKTQPIIKRMLDEGHTIGSHHHDHDNNNQVDKATFKYKLQKSFEILKKSFKDANHPMEYFYYRFPYAAYGSQSRDYHHLNVLRETSYELFGKNCIHFVFWDIDSSDWVKDVSSSDVYNNVLSYEHGGVYYTYKTVNGRIIKIKKNIQNPTQGGTILLHDIQDKTVLATKLLLEEVDKSNMDIIPLDSTDEYDYRNDGCSPIL